MHLNRSLRSLPLMGLAAVALAGCGSSGKSSSTASATAAAPLIQRATQLALNAAKGEPGASGKLDPIFAAWRAAHIGDVAAADAPGAGQVSQQAAIDNFPTAYDKNNPSAQNPYTFWFVTISGGRCVGGVVYGYPTITSARTFTANLPASRCRGSEVTYRDAGFPQAATATATTTAGSRTSSTTSAGPVDYRAPGALRDDATMRLNAALKANPTAYRVTPGTVVTFATCQSERHNRLRYVCLFRLSNKRDLAYVYLVSPDGATYRPIRTLTP